MKQVLLTLDYELYGDGSGDVFKHVIEPTEKILSIANRYDAKLTFFFEVVEYWKIKEEWNDGNTMGYEQNPIEAMENQIKKAVADGHDVQLHIHPQWIDAKWHNERWNVNLSEWKLGTYEREGDYSLVNILKKGKCTLEEIIRPVKSDYRCIGLRAGGYNAQPSVELVKAMREVGLRIDSSIYPGGFENGILSVYDYTKIPNDRGRWFVNQQLEDFSNTESDIEELPIVSMKVARWRKYASLDRIKAIIKNLKVSKRGYEEKVFNQSGASKNTVFRKVKFLFESECQTWDFCILSPSVHKSFLKHIEKMSNRKLFVLIGHPKSYIGDTGIKYIFRMLYKKGFIFITMNNFVNKYFLF